jgi:hypothetical protein
MARANLSFVMAGPSASKTRVKRAYVPAIHVLLAVQKTWMPATGAGMTVERSWADIADPMFGVSCP